MAQPQTDPHDSKVRSVPLPPDEDVITQENQGPEGLGGGEWPDPEEPPRGPAPGDDRDAEPPTTGEVDSAAGTYEPMREVLEADPVAGGSSSVPDDDDNQSRRPPASLL